MKLRKCLKEFQAGCELLSLWDQVSALLRSQKFLKDQKEAFSVIMIAAQHGANSLSSKFAYKTFENFILAKSLKFNLKVKLISMSYGEPEEQSRRRW